MHHQYVAHITEVGLRGADAIFNAVTLHSDGQTILQSITALIPQSDARELRLGDPVIITIETPAPAESKIVDFPMEASHVA